MLKTASHNFEIPRETAEIARKACRDDNPYIKLRDKLDIIYEEGKLAHLFSTQGQPGISPVLLIMVTIMQFMEGLSDRQASNAVRARIDWKYALGLELTDPGFDDSVLCEFRNRLIDGKCEQQILDRLLEVCHEHNLIKTRGKQRTDATHVEAAIRQLNRLELIGESLRYALNSIASVNREWIAALATPDWFEMYSTRIEEYRLPNSKEKRAELAQQIGTDGYILLNAVFHQDAPANLRELPAIYALHRIWLQQFHLKPSNDKPATPHLVRLRQKSDQPPCPDLIASPYDCEARFSRKRQTQWVGYKAHLTETCDEDTPNLITHVLTTSGAESDVQAVPTIHQALHQKGLTPETHLVDSGYVSGVNLVDSTRDHEVELLGPPLKNTSWQAHIPDAFDHSSFSIDWTNEVVTCPQKQQSTTWHYSTSRSGTPTVKALFSKRTCLDCPLRERCTTATTRGRTLQFRHQDEHVALQNQRLRESTPDFQQMYNARAGVEGTISQATRAFDLRRSRYLGLAKTRLHHLLLATAINFSRIAAWFSEQRPCQTRISAFSALNST